MWTPSPDDAGAHAWFLAHLIHMGVPFNDAPLSTRVQGNLGECCCLLIGREQDFAGFFCHAANAFNPLQDISRSEIDIVWVALAPNPIEDLAILQEVKTTGGHDLDYATSLVTDYEKLFGSDPALTLNTRLAAVANTIEYGTILSTPHADRIRLLAQRTPQATSNVMLLPSVVYDRTLVTDPQPKMAAVRQSIVSAGWDPPWVESWAVGIGDLLSRLSRLKAGTS